ncbi:MAG TPA: hypothetical protein VFQ23_21295 [Anaerolineales bacterium]|nr:hypothetical protein [Anaerolineales bacterium]
MNSDGRLEHPFIREWVKANLIGWLLGILFGMFLFHLIITPLVWSFFDVDYDVYSKLEPIFLSFPLGAGVGIFQQRNLERWKIQLSSWALLTTLSLGIPITLITWVFQTDVMGYRVPIIASIAEIVIVSLSVGGLQAYLLRQSLSRPIRWVQAYLFGSLAITVIEFILMAVAFLAAEPIQKLLYSVDLWVIVEYREALLLFSIALIFPFLAAFFIGLPTGRMLYNTMS